MPQIFHPSLNTVSRVTIFGAVIGLGGTVLLAGLLVRSPWATEVGVVRAQPVPFSHQHHVGDVGIDCRYCHATVETSAFAGMPSSELCLDCHSQLWRDSPMLAPVRDSVASGRPLRWTRVHDLPDHAYFHHGIHTHQGIACSQCHGDVGEMPLMYREETLHMEWCLQCHRNPKQQIRSAEDSDRGAAPAGDSLADVAQVQTSEGEAAAPPHPKSKTDCSVCHR